MAITSKEINLMQLDKELGGHGLICNFGNPVEKLILAAGESPVTEKELENAISKHIAVDEEAIRALAKALVLNRLGITADEAKLLLS